MEEKELLPLGMCYMGLIYSSKLNKILVFGAENEQKCYCILFQ